MPDRPRTQGDEDSRGVNLVAWQFYRFMLNSLILILGPVFPHEVVGFSCGAKYLFHGISGGPFLHFFHWLGALN